jgi:hypothetical protein
MVHGVEPLLPFNLAEAMYLVPDFDQDGKGLMTTEELIAERAKMLQKRTQDLKRVRGKVFQARWESVKQLEKRMKNKIQDLKFNPGSLVLV